MRKCALTEEPSSTTLQQFKTPIMTDHSTMMNVPFRFLDLPIELRLEVYKHVASNTHQRRFFSDVPVSFSETDFSILASCKLIYTEALNCMHNVRLDRPPTIKIAYDEKNFGILEEMQVCTLQTLRQVIAMLILGRKSDYSATNTHNVPLEYLSSASRDMMNHHSEHEQI